MGIIRGHLDWSRPVVKTKGESLWLCVLQDRSGTWNPILVYSPVWPSNHTTLVCTTISSRDEMPHLASAFGKRETCVLCTLSWQKCIIGTSFFTWRSTQCFSTGNICHYCEDVYHIFQVSQGSNTTLYCSGMIQQKPFKYFLNSGQLCAFHWNCQNQLRKRTLDKITGLSLFLLFYPKYLFEKHNVICLSVECFAHLFLEECAGQWDFAPC